MKIKDLMATDVKTCRPHDTLNRAAQLMWDHDIGCAPVVDDAGNLCGMLTDRDICMSAYTRGGDLNTLRVRDAMSTDVCTCGPTADVGDAEDLMRTMQLRRIPVVNGGHVVGMIALNDIAVAAGGNRKTGISFQEVGQTMASICRHRDVAATGSAA